MNAEISRLAAICRRVYEKGFVSAYDGNLSLRTSRNTVLITRSGINKGEVGEGDIFETDTEGNLLKGEGKISTESKIHFYIYKKRKDVNAVVHCHPVYTTAFAVSKDEFPSYILPEVILTLGSVPICEYATPSTEQVPESLAPHIGSGWAYILKNHGAVTLGASIEDAYYKMEKLEHTARIFFAATLLGGAKRIPEDKVDELIEISEKAYGIKIKKEKQS